MYNIRQFRPLFYAVLMLSVVGYGIALESAPHSFIGLILIWLNARVTRGERFFSIPRWLASLIAVTAGAWALVAFLQGAISPMVAVSHWLYFLLLVIIWSHHDNRAFAQAFGMSLVLMVVGAINTASLLFGLIFFAYLLLSLYWSLLFHLKVESDHAIHAYHLSKENVDLAARGGDAQFTSSMRRLTMLVSLVSITLGILVFLFFPRAEAPSLMMRMGAPQQSAMTGFSERVSLDQVARITQNQEIVAYVGVKENGQSLRSEDLYLRGMTLDLYTGQGTRRDGMMSWQWVRSDRLWEAGPNLRAQAGKQLQFRESSGRRIVQHIVLRPTGTATLFAMDGAYAIEPSHEINLHFFPLDNTIRSFDIPKSQLQYDVISDGQTPTAIAEEPQLPPEWMARPSGRRGFGGTDMGGPRVSRIDPSIAEYALRSDVSGTDAKGALADQRGKNPGPNPLDAQIAANITRHFHSQFKYTLDLSDNTRSRQEDPIVNFLYKSRRGHCEYFAGAMTLLCQSMGMQARMVIGFRAGPEDYSDIGDYYVVRQSHAHAWVEVLTVDGWTRFDPTSGTEYFSQRHRNAWLRSVSDFFNFLQYKWATSIVTYSNDNRLSVWQNIESAFTGSLEGGSSLASWFKDFFRSDQVYLLSSRLLVAAIAGSILILLAAIAIFILEKRRLYRRAHRIGLSALPSDEQLRLARKLGFYDELIRLLARQHIHRPADMTPREFARSLSFLPAEAYGDICDLTDIYYGVRYGDHELRQGQRRRLSVSIGELSAALASLSRVKPYKK